jgi:hypothetical protein
MKYLLIFDLRGNGAGRRRVNRYLQRVACRYQRSVWKFEDMHSLVRASGLVKDAGGKVMAFVESDQILLDKFEIKQHLESLKNGRRMMS